jgi:hypothetical protein
VNDEQGLDSPLKDGSEGGARTTRYTYNVKYVISGTEKRIDAQWIVSKNPLNVNRAESAAARHGEQQKRREEIAAAEKAAALKEWEDKQAKLAKRMAARDGSLQELATLRKAAQAKAELRKADAQKDAAASAARKRKREASAAERAQKKAARAEAAAESAEHDDAEADEDAAADQQFADEPASPEPAEREVTVDPRLCLVQTALSTFLRNRQEEVPLETLKDELNRACGEGELQFTDGEVEGFLRVLEDENRVMYRAEVVWII